ncbi:MAG: ABC transporter ATP-binding protein [Treponema sp.]|jgi:lipoprotein-releasing system ATP-binding protein|nr:ABC transporter ATP-binding protein [Treponema sp.]
MNEHKRSLIKVSNIVKNYLSGTETLHILKGVNFEIEEGKSAAIMGISGSGKSTLLNIIGGLDRADEGNVFIGGDEITSFNEKEMSQYRSKRIGFIFQFHYLLKDFSALENVMLPAFMAGMKKKEAVKRAEVLLADVKLEDRKNHFPSQLSGGERQRVAVARSMVNDPALILADEPTGNLDSQNSEIVTHLLYENAQKWGKTLIVVTHDKKIAQKASIQLVLENGLLKNEQITLKRRRIKKRGYSLKSNKNRRQI